MAKAAIPAFNPTLAVISIANFEGAPSLSCQDPFMLPLGRGS